MLQNRLSRFSGINISHGSVAVPFKSGGIFNYCVNLNLLLRLHVKQFWKSVKIWRSSRQKYSGTFLNMV